MKTKKIIFYIIWAFCTNGLLFSLTTYCQTTAQPNRIFKLKYFPPVANGDRKLTFTFELSRSQEALLITSGCITIFYAESQNSLYTNNRDGITVTPISSSSGHPTIKKISNNRNKVKFLGEFIFPHNSQSNQPNSNYYNQCVNNNISVLPGVNSSEFDQNPKILEGCVSFLIKVLDRPVQRNAVSEFCMPHTFNIAIAGDSYGAGEGAPNTLRSDRDFDGMDNCDMWERSGFAHQSQNSGLLQGVKRFERQNVEIAVSVIFTASSGAVTDNLFNIAQDCTPMTQFDYIRQSLRNKSENLDLVLMSIGGNDMNFSTFVQTFFANQYIGYPQGNMFPPPLRADRCLALVDRISQDLNTLKNRYNALNDRVRIFSPNAKIIISDYPNPCRGVDGWCGNAQSWEQFGRLYNCSLFEVSPPLNLINPLGLPNFPDLRVNPPEEYQWTAENYIGRINDTIKTTASKLNWDVVDVADGMGSHGICNCDDPYINTAAAVVPITGVTNDRVGCVNDQDCLISWGMVHPNQRGYRMIYEAPVVNKITEVYNRCRSNSTVTPCNQCQTQNSGVQLPPVIGPNSIPGALPKIRH